MHFILATIISKIVCPSGEAPNENIKLLDLWYNSCYVGLNFKLDIGLYRLYQQVACQRYRQTQTTAERKSLIADLSTRLFPQTAPVAIAA